MNWLKKGKYLLIYGLGQSINILSPLLITPYIMQISGEVGLGKIGICLSICYILMGILDYSSYLEGTKKIVIHKNNPKKLSQLIAAIYSYKILLVTILFIPSIIIPLIFFPDFFWVFVLSLSMLLGHLLNPNWILYGLEDFTNTAIYNIISKLLYLLLVFIIVKYPSDYIWVNFLQGFCSIWVYLYAFLAIYRQRKLEFNFQSFQNGIQILKKNYTLSLSEFCMSIYQYFPIVIVGYFTGAYYAGIYRVVEQIFGVFRTFIILFFNYSYPSVSGAFHRQFKHGVKLWSYYHGFNIVVILLSSLLVFYFRQPVLNFFHIDVSDLVYVESILQLALIVPILIVISQALRQFMLSLNLIAWYTRIIYGLTVTNLILMLILVPFYNLYGVFIALILSELFMITAYVICIKKMLP